MKKIFIAFVISFFCSSSFSQSVYYAAAKAGLTLREQPNTNARVLEKIPYGEKLVTVADAEPRVAIATEGFSGFWYKIKYKDKTGYIVSSYVLPVAVPKAGTKTLQDYFAQLSVVAGTPLIIKNADPTLSETGESSLTKKIFRNGMEWHNTLGYESSSDLYFLPGFSIEQCFLLLKLIGQYPGLIAEKDAFPLKNSVMKNDTGNKTIEVEREKHDGKPGPVKKVRIILEQGAITEFEIFMLDTQAVISWSSGV